MADPVYNLRYRLDLEAGRFTKADADRAKNQSLCDACIFVSILYPEDGSYAALLRGKDARSGALRDLSPKELWKFWLTVGAMLSKHAELDGARREVAAVPVRFWMERT